jgi:hypothetical protein
MNFGRTEIAVIVKSLKMFRKGFATMRTFITLVSFFRFAMFVSFMMTAERAFQRNK